MLRFKSFCASVLVCGVIASAFAAAPLRFEKSGSFLELSADGLQLRELGCAGVPNRFTGPAPLWRLWRFDEETARRNVWDGKGYAWNCDWKQGENFFDSTSAEFAGHTFDAERGIVTLRYRHPDADVTLFFYLLPGEIRWDGEVVNRGGTALYQFDTTVAWSLNVSPEESVILPDWQISGIEYRSIHWGYFTNVNAWDGFLVADPAGRLLSLHRIQAHETGPILATETRMESEGRPGAPLKVSSGTLIFRRKGETVRSVEIKFAAYPSLRSWADGYVRDNFPTLKPLSEKLSPALFERLSRAMLIALGGKFTDAAAVLPCLPGTVMAQGSDYMNPGPEKLPTWDAFPDYFPPNPRWGSTEEYRDLIGKLKAAGHLYLPRTSSYHWTVKTVPDLKYDNRTLAVVRSDGHPVTAYWTRPGFLMSPSSRIVRQLNAGYQRQWRDAGADEVYFTNVIGAITPWSIRYDFHPDAESPDLFYEALRQSLADAGHDAALFTEGAGAWQLPYQAGFCTELGKDPAAPGPGYFLDPTRGDFKRYRRDIGGMLDHEYVQFYPHNVNADSSCYNISTLSHSLLYGYSLKYQLVFPLRAGFDVRRFRAMLFCQQKLNSAIFGKRLEAFEFGDDLFTADYGDVKIEMNPHDHEVAVPEGKLGDYGFRFVSERLFAGYFTEFGGRRFHRPQLLILEKTSSTERELYLPLASAPETVAIPACNAQITVVPQSEAIEAPFTPAARFNTANPPFDAPAPEPAEETATVIPEPAASFPEESFPYRREWNLERCPALPDGLRGDAGRMHFTADGVQLKPNAGLIVESSASFRKRLYLECIFRLDQMPEWSNQYMEDNILVASDKGRTVELRFNLAMNGTRFLIPMAAGSLEDIQELTVPVEAGKWYHVIAGYDGAEQFLEIDGRRVSRKRTGELRAPVMPWRVCPKLSATIRFLRVAGE